MPLPLTRTLQPDDRVIWLHQSHGLSRETVCFFADPVWRGWEGDLASAISGEEESPALLLDSFSLPASATSLMSRVLSTMPEPSTY
jgi:hypothetical protein